MLTNAFSLNMLPAGFSGLVHVKSVTAEIAKMAVIDGGSAVGHGDTAAVFSAALGYPVPVARRTVALAKGDVIVVGQYRGPRLAPGATTLPEGATIEWLEVTVLP